MRIREVVVEGDKEYFVSDYDNCTCWYIERLPGIFDFHRELGPAIEYYDGRVRWFYNGKEFANERLWKLKAFW